MSPEDLQRQFLQSAGHVIPGGVAPGHVTAGGVAPTAVAERVSDDDDVDDARKFHRVQLQPDGYCQCENSNLPREFRAIQRSVATASKMVPPRPLRSASVDRHGDAWSGTGSVKRHPVHGGSGARHSGSSSAYRVSTPTDLVVLRGSTRTSRRHRTTPPPSAVPLPRDVQGVAAHHVDSTSDMSDDLDHDIVDDLHLTEFVPSFTRRSTDTLRTSTSTDFDVDSQHPAPAPRTHHQNGWITAAERPPVILRRASAQDQSLRVSSGGTPRTQRAGSYHGSVHHSVTLPEFPSNTSSRLHGGGVNRSPVVGSLKNALVSLAGRWLRTSKTDLSVPAEDGKTGCSAMTSEHGAGLMSRIVARASCRLPRHRSKSGDRCLDDRPRTVAAAVAGGRVTVSALSLPLTTSDDLMTSSGSSRTMNEHAFAGSGEQDVGLVNSTDQPHVPYIDDSESEYS